MHVVLQLAARCAVANVAHNGASVVLLRCTAALAVRQRMACVARCRHRHQQPHLPHLLLSLVQSQQMAHVALLTVVNAVLPATAAQALAGVVPLPNTAVLAARLHMACVAWRACCAALCKYHVYI